MGGFTMNSRRKFIRQLAGASAGLAVMNLPEQLLAAEDLIRLSIVHTNDIHSHIDPFPDTDPSYAGQGGMARLSGLVKQIRQENENVLLLDAGDMFQGTPYFNFYKGELILKVMSEMGYDASTIGNHEFDNGLDGISQVIDFARFPLISSNYDFSQTSLYDSFPKYAVFHKSGIKVGLYGLGIELEGLVSKKNYGDTIYLDPVKTAIQMESFLKNEKKCDLVVCLSHLGLSYRNNKISDTVLAGETHFTDLIIGGHTHTFLEAPLEMKNADGKRIIVNQAGWGGLMAGRIDFIFDKARKSSPVGYLQNLLTVS
ncbi:MAG: bifunctional UDP-sugar hydrolase/5'-nucleotidase [Mangrovibacterium sp.]